MNLIGSIFKGKTEDTNYGDKAFYSLCIGSKALSSVCAFKCALDCLKFSSSAGHLGHWGIAYAGHLSYVVLFIVSMILCVDVAVGIINRVGQLLS